MSRSPTEAVPAGEAADYLEAFRQTFRLAERGRSFSGREPNMAFLNLGDGRFADVSAVSGLAFPDDGRAAAVIDWDLDGDLDLWLANRTAPRLRLMRNEIGAGAPFVAFRLVGTAANRDAVGARVELGPGLAGAGSRIAERRAGSGFLSQSSAWLHFGLGMHRADGPRSGSVTVTWPGGGRQTLTGIEAGNRYVLVQGEAEPRRWAPPERPALRLAPEPLTAPAPETPPRVVLTGRPAVPPLAYRTFEGTAEPVAAGDGRPVLLNLWASWCAPCVRELGDLTAARVRLADAGLRVLALSVDGLDDGARTGPAEARAMLERLAVPFAAGMAHADLLDVLQVLHDRLFSYHLALPVPTSFLLDGAGRLAAIYRGPVDPDRLLADVAGLDLPPLERRALSTPAEGRWLTEPQALRSTTIAERFVEEERYDTAAFYLRRALGEVAPEVSEAAAVSVRLGDVLMTAGRFEEAVPHYRQALEHHPGDARTARHLGDALAASGRSAEAAEAYRTSIAAAPDDPAARRGLGAALLRVGRAEEAAGALREAVELGADSAETRNDLGLAMAAVGDLDGARRELERAVELRPDFAEAHNNLGVVLLRSGLREPAIRHFRRALALRPGYADAAENLAAAAPPP